jgi:hypothetical protein
MGDSDREDWRRRIGTGGASLPMEIVTRARTRFTVLAEEPGMLCEAASASPDAPTRRGTGVWFFRNDGTGKSQFCVRFPSGAVQILASEP